MEEKKPKVEWKNADTVKVSSITIERSGTNGEFVDRVRFHRKDGIDITYKPRKKVESKSELAGFSTVITKTEMITFSDFLLENQMLQILNENTKTQPQDVVMTYAVMTVEDDDGNKTKYAYMRDTQFNTIYYADFHKEDKTNLNKQKEIKINKG